MEKKNIRTAKRWAFLIVVGAFAILQVTKGETLLAMWVVLAAVCNYVASCFEDRCEDLEKDREDLITANRDNAKIFDEIITANHDLAEELKKEQAKNAELQEEINWTRLEHQYAGMAMQGALNNSLLITGLLKVNKSHEDIVAEVTGTAVRYAHTLVEKLKEKEERK